MSGEAHHYRGSLDAWSSWTTAAFQWLLLDASQQSFDATFTTVADIRAYELTTGGYSRLPVDTPRQADTVTSGQSYRYYGCEPAHFVDLVAGQTIGALILAVNRGSDNQSTLVAHWSVPGPTSVGDISYLGAPWYDEAGDPLPGGGPATGWVQRVVMS